MKTFKRFSAILLAVLMMVAMMAAPASAATITVADGSAGTTYTFYKIFDVEYTDDNDITGKDSSYLYTITDDLGDSKDWYSWLETNYGGYFNFTGTETPNKYYVVAKASFTDSVAGVLAAAAKSAMGDTLSASSAFSTTGTTPVTVTSDGYYLMTVSTGNAACSLLTTDMSREITQKASYPSITKAVDKSNVNIGDTLTYTITIEVAATTFVDYIVKDVLPEGICDAAITSVKWGGTDVTGKNEYYTASGLVITLKQAKIDALNQGDAIVITYTAKLDTDATIGASGNQNTASLYYLDSDGDGDMTDEVDTNKVATAIVYTGSLSFNKYIKDTTIYLADAKFVLKNGDGKFAKLTGSDPTYTFNGWEDTQTYDTVITTEDEKITIKGLADGVNYKLVEIDAPDGYVGAGETTILVDHNDTTKVFDVYNTPGKALPETGGIGTTIFYAVGGVLMVGALALVLLRKRTGAN